VERLEQLRTLAIEPERATRVHQNIWLQLARKGGQSTVRHLAELDPLRRHATLTAVVLELIATLTDEALIMFDRLIGRLFHRGCPEHAHDCAPSGSRCLASA
jgi:hypothetical protein